MEKNSNSITREYIPVLHPMENVNGVDLYETEIAIAGEPYFYVDIYVMSSTQQLQEGTFHFTSKTIPGDRDPGEINSCRVSYGSAKAMLLMDPNTEGSFTVDKKGNTYIFDLSTTLDGHVIQLHYEGASHVFSPT